MTGSSREAYAPVLEHFRPGAVIHIPGSVGELRGLRDALAAEPEVMRGVTLVAGLIPGLNTFDYAGLHPQARLRVFMMSEALRGGFGRGQLELMPLAYSDSAAHMMALHADLAVLHLTPPLAGRCSFGIGGDFGPLAALNAKVRIGVLNASMPRPALSPGWALADLDATVQVDEPLPTYAEPASSPELDQLARHVAELVENGAAIQTGIGAAPAAVWRALERREGLVLRSGMVTDGFLRALRAGAMRDDVRHLAGIALGGEELLAWLDGQDLVEFADVRTTHGQAALQDVPNFTSINSALEVDLFGQANLEWQPGRMISGVGGAPDFVRAARASPGGRSIVALPATARGGGISRIVTRLSTPSISMSRADAGTVVTEHGAADLSGLDLDRRAEALMAIAAPPHRDGLRTAWRALRAAI